MQPDALPTGADLAASVVAFFTAGFSKLITCGVIILICLLAVFLKAGSPKIAMWILLKPIH